MSTAYKRVAVYINEKPVSGLSITGYPDHLRILLILLDGARGASPGRKESRNVVRMSDTVKGNVGKYPEM